MALYQKREVEANQNKLGLVLQGTDGSADLVALYNMSVFKYASTYGRPGPVTEDYLKSILSDLLNKCLDQFDMAGMPASTEADVRRVLSNIRTHFSLQPRLSGLNDFVSNASYLLCCILQFPVYHGWVLDPTSTSYDDLNTLSYEELLKHSRELDQEGEKEQVCDTLLGDYKNQLTSYGLHSLLAVLEADDLALFFYRNRLNIIHKHDGVLFIFVSDEDIHRKMPKASFVVFEEWRKNQEFYLTTNYIPVKGQPKEKEAKEWYLRHLRTLREKKNDETVPKPSEPNVSLDELTSGKQPSHHGHQSLDEPTQGNQSGQMGRSCRKVPESSKTNVEVKSSDERTQGKQSAQQKQSHHKVPKSSETDAGEVKSLDELKKLKHSSQHGQPQHGVTKSSEPDAGEDKPSCDLTLYDGKRAEASGSHQSGGQDDNRCSPDKDKTKEAQSVDMNPEVALKGVAKLFFSFLDNFQDDGCSKYYFDGMAAAFPTQSPMFYVPYDFIVAYDEKLALDIQDNYTSISKDLKKSVVLYLSKKGVNFPDVVLKIIDLPDPKSVQFFLDFIESIDLHEHYLVYDGVSEALLSYDSRRMGLGYLRCIIAKFKTGKCWGGKWSEPNMKVKNKGSEFVIDYKEDYDLSPDLGFEDLSKFCGTVLERLKFNEKLPPFSDELQEDMMLINECFGKPEAWERFLELISNPLVLKPPLVRTSFLCNVYIAGQANSSGDPPRYNALFRSLGCLDWTTIASTHPLLRKVYDYQNERRIKKLRYYIDKWTAKHWHVFKFSRHVIQHVLDHTKDENLIQLVKDISEVDILLSRTMCKAIARSVRYLVLNCGVDGLFSSAWRHYAGSDYVDKPNERPEDARIGGMVQGLLDSISDDNITGYVYSEVTKYESHRAVIFIDADLKDLQTKLNENGLKCELVEGRLCCGSTSLWKRDCPATEKCGPYTAIVIEGPYSVGYDSVYYCVTEWLAFNVTLFLNLEKADEDEYSLGVLKPYWKPVGEFFVLADQ